MSVIVPPDTFEEKVVILPDQQHPFGPNCDLDRTIQSMLFHYGIGTKEAKVLEDVGFVAIKYLREANPDGDDEERDLYESTVASQITNPLMKRLMLKAVRRLLSTDPLEPLVEGARASSSSSSVAPPAKRQKTTTTTTTTATTATSSDTASASSQSSSTTASSSDGDSSKAKKSKSAKSSKNDEDDFSSDSDDDDDAVSTEETASAEVSKSESTRSKTKDLASLFEDVDAEVRLWLLIDMILGCLVVYTTVDNVRSQSCLPCRRLCEWSWVFCFLSS